MAVLVAVDPDPRAAPGRDAGERQLAVRQLREEQQRRPRDGAEGLFARDELVRADVEEPELVARDTGLRDEVALALLGARDEEVDALGRRRDVLRRQRDLLSDTTQTSPVPETATATGSRPTVTELWCASPDRVTRKISRRLSGVLTA
ncbi:hypothetical protein WMF37_11535 [Sorangium sp. So ce291]